MMLIGYVNYMMLGVLVMCVQYPRIVITGKNDLILQLQYKWNQ